MTHIATDPGANNVRFTIGAEAGDIINVAVALLNSESAVAGRHAVGYYLSSDAAGDTLAADPGTTAIGTDGTILAEHTDDIVGMVLTEADGTFDLDITSVGTPTVYLNVILPSGRVFTSEAITFA